MEARDYYWRAMNEIVYYRIIVDMKLAWDQKVMMCLNIVFSILGAGSLGSYLLYNNCLSLIACLVSQCYQACHYHLPWIKDVKPLQHAADRYDLLGEQVEAVWNHIDSMDDESIWAEIKQFESRSTKLIGRLYREGIGFSRYEKKAKAAQTEYMKRFNSETAFAKEDKPEA